MTLELVVILGLATYRLARAVAVDDITEPFRSWLYRRAAANPGSRFRTQTFALFSCSFCVGFWLAGIVSAAFYLATDWPGTVEWLIVWFAAAGAGAIGSSIDLWLQTKAHHD